MKKLFILLALSIVLVVGFYGAKRTPSLPEPSLAELASRQGLSLGNHAIYSRISEPEYRHILTTQFDFVLADNTPNWSFTDGGMRPSRTSFHFDQMDELIRFAEQHDMPVQAHHYLWGDDKWLPSWLKEGDYTPEQLSDIMRDHILTVGSRYQGKIREWTVVNEAFTRQQHLYGLHDWWADHTGSLKYVDDAFIWARQADPDSKLILNDFQNESLNSVSNTMYDYVKSARARGIPIDGIGMQMHIDGTHPPTKDEVIANMKRFGELGVSVYVTEFDVNMHDVPVGAGDKDKIAANIYYEMVRACIESRVCHSFAFLGITDKETWYNYLGLNEARPLMFDDNYRPKPAFHAVRRALQEK